MELSELSRAAAGEECLTVAVREATAPAALAQPLASSAHCEANAREFLLRIPEVATYYARDGKEVVVDALPEADGLDVRGYLTGTIFSALCHQRGLLPLHASAVAGPHGAVAFLGASGAGKSTMVAFLARRGHRVLADDICLIDPEAPRASRVLPVAPWMKLWRTSLDALGESDAGLVRAFTDDDKYRVMLPQDMEATQLAEIVLLDTLADEAGREPSFERLAPVHAMHAVLELTCQTWLVRALGQTEAQFLRCGKALEGVRVTRMRRPWGFAGMDATVTALEAHLAAQQ